MSEEVFDAYSKEDNINWKQVLYPEEEKVRVPATPFFAGGEPKISEDLSNKTIDNPRKADRYNKGKRNWSLVHWKSVEPLVEVLEFGCKKYSRDNWKKGLDKKEILDSMMRHLTTLIDGEENDNESKLSHMGHIMCNAMFYNYFDDKDQTDVVK